MFLPPAFRAGRIDSIVHGVDTRRCFWPSGVELTDERVSRTEKIKHLQCRRNFEWYVYSQFLVAYISRIHQLSFHVVAEVARGVKDEAFDRECDEGILEILGYIRRVCQAL